MLYIIDNFLEEGWSDSLDIDISEKVECEWDMIRGEPKVNDLFVAKVLETANKYYNIEDLGWYEIWSHKNSRPLEWHYDKHENLYAKTGELVFPLCSCVYYPTLYKDLKGGELLLETSSLYRHDRIQPIANRLVLFSPGVHHAVNAFRGKRTSININPWPYWRSLNEGSIIE